MSWPIMPQHIMLICVHTYWLGPFKEFLSLFLNYHNWCLAAKVGDKSVDHSHTYAICTYIPLAHFRKACHIFWHCWLLELTVIWVSKICTVFGLNVGQPEEWTGSTSSSCSSYLSEGQLLPVLKGSEGGYKDVPEHSFLHWLWSGHQRITPLATIWLQPLCSVCILLKLYGFGNRILM